MIAQIIQPKCLMPTYKTDYDGDDGYEDVVYDYGLKAWVPRKQYLDNQQKEIVVFKAAVFVQGDFAHNITEDMFFKRGYEIVSDLDLADIVVWTGGADINPALYGERPRGAVGWSDFRDDDDCRAVKRAMKNSQFMVGVCRGAQLLNCVANDGTLWQHVDRHGSTDHKVRDLVTGKEYLVNSIHHQAMRPGRQAEVLAVTSSPLSSVKQSYKDSWHVDEGPEDQDIEALWYPDTKSLCMQWHPEFASNCASESYAFNLIDRYYHSA